MSTELTATPATKKRIAQLTKTLLPEVGRLWKPVLDAGLDLQIWNLLDTRNLPALDPALAFLESKFDTEFLALAPLESLVFPDLTGVATDGKPADKTAHLFLLTCFHTAAHHISDKSLTLLELAQYDHYLTEMETIETGNLSFYPFPSDSIGSGDPLPLTKIPPTIFSEVLRDVDLAASVAYVGEGYWTSTESRVRRRDLLDAIVADFALRGVTTDGKYAEVKGALANYKVHLDTGAIYIGGSNHICVIPDNSKATPENIYLPFTAEDDPKLREVVSRILMLLNDDKIRDKTILEQIKNVTT